MANNNHLYYYPCDGYGYYNCSQNFNPKSNLRFDFKDVIVVPSGYKGVFKAFVRCEQCGEHFEIPLHDLPKRIRRRLEKIF